MLITVVSKDELEENILTVDLEEDFKVLELLWKSRQEFKNFKESIKNI